MRKGVVGKPLRKPSAKQGKKSSKSKEAPTVSAKKLKGSEISAKSRRQPETPTQLSKKTSKEISPELLEAITRRKLSPGIPPKPRGRRGRRPKALTEYVPEHQEEENYNNENDYEGLAYDTGIQVKQARDDGSHPFERVEDFDEELNFDW